MRDHWLKPTELMLLLLAAKSILTDQLRKVVVMAK